MVNWKLGTGMATFRRDTTGSLVTVTVAVGVAVGLGLAVAVGVGLGVSPGLSVAVGRGVAVAVGGGLVGVAVAGGPDVGVGVASSPQAMMNKVSPTARARTPCSRHLEDRLSNLTAYLPGALSWTTFEAYCGT